MASSAAIWQSRVFARLARRGRRGLDPIALVRAEVNRLFFGDARFDLVISHNGLRGFPTPDVSPAEMGRCLRRGARLLGASPIKRAPSSALAHCDAQRA